MTTGLETNVFTAAELLEHWQGHRRLTRRVIEAFPEPIAHGVASGEWVSSTLTPVKTKAELLDLWDKATTAINKIWPTIPAHRFAEVDTAFGQWKSSGIGTILYAIDNETHHRGQAFVYLRTLGIEPPAFYDRS
jgi:uncharacterized damage-inducible protein DinB